MQSIPQDSPLMSKVLGYSGLIPFVGLAALLLLADEVHHLSVVFALQAYSATILSFLGAIHWGLTMREEQPSPSMLLWGVAPSLLAWASLLVLPHWGLWTMAAALWACYAVDFKTYVRLGLVRWLPMRLILTAVASMCCAWAGIWVYLQKW
ncbi:MAG: DUF3429 domain-containing protein [Betaproteobacteria bacterium]|nr:DUF3429 domain-containing protein [Betaproteobacteria bacterium]